MGKIVKFCSSCDENFAEKFGFCPNCGASLQAFEMSPVAAAETAVAVPRAPAFIEPVEEVPVTPAEPVIEAAPADKPVVEEPVKKAAPKVAAAAVAAPVFFQKEAKDADAIPASLEDEHSEYAKHGDFYVTVIEEKNAGQRNGLLLGTLAFMIFAVFAGLVINIFSKDLKVGAISDDMFLASLIDDVPTTIEEEEKPKNKDDGGGGGGGGREEDETTLGDRANQTPNPQRPPQAIPRLENPLQLPPASTQGNRTFEQRFDRFGDPNGRFTNWNNGSGSGGGQGTGYGTGQGSGRGTGTGSGSGSGSGSGLGSGNGSGTGRGGSDGDEPPPAPVGVTQALRIISKPRPGYTDAARQNNVQGTVILRVTFLASGGIGSISSVKGLPYGLTEQAIAAARRISFEPKKINGIGQPVTRQIEYTFSIY
jgi:TonB family protein